MPPKGGKRPTSSEGEGLFQCNGDLNIQFGNLDSDFGHDDCRYLHGDRSVELYLRYQYLRDTHINLRDLQLKLTPIKLDSDSLQQLRDLKLYVSDRLPHHLVQVAIPVNSMSL